MEPRLLLPDSAVATYGRDSSLHRYESPHVAKRNCSLEVNEKVCLTCRRNAVEFDDAQSDVGLLGDWGLTVKRLLLYIDGVTLLFNPPSPLSLP